jgi:hypothetical protein
MRTLITHKFRIFACKKTSEKRGKLKVKNTHFYPPAKLLVTTANEGNNFVKNTHFYHPTLAVKY